MNVFENNKQHFFRRRNTRRNNIRRSDDVRIVQFIVRDVSIYKNEDLIKS